MTIDDTLLIAWLDGELGASEARAVAAAVASDLALARKAAAHQALTDRLRHAFAPLLTEPVPPSLVAKVRMENATMVDLASARSVRSAAAVRRFALPQWAAIAATLVVGVAAGQLAGTIGKPPPLLAEHNGNLEARGILAKALDTELASAPSTGTIRVALTFRDRDGGLCRTWSAPAEAGIGCRSGSDWRIVTTAATAPTSASGYRMASAGDPRLMAAVETMIVGKPLDATQERRARDTKWQ